MFELIKKYKKGVSPVIAVVLLIALTVAAAAVIWTIVSDTADIDTTTVNISVNNAENITLNDLRIVMTIDSNVEATATGITFLSGPSGFLPTSSAVAFVDANIIDGDTTLTVTFTLATGAWLDGSYSFNLVFTPTGATSRTAEASFTLTV